jgi:hypothetical protein
MERSSPRLPIENDPIMIEDIFSLDIAMFSSQESTFFILGSHVQDIITKYKVAADIAGRALQQIISLCAPGADIAMLCAFGDTYMTEQVHPLCVLT